MIQLHGTRASPIPSFLYSEDELLCAASSWNFKRKTKTEGLVKTCPINNVSFGKKKVSREKWEKDMLNRKHLEMQTAAFKHQALSAN